MEGSNVPPGLEQDQRSDDQGGGEQLYQPYTMIGTQHYEDQAPPSGSAACNLIVNYLPSSVTEESLRALFTPYGEVTSCKLMKDKQTGQSLGYGFIEYRDPQSAQQSIEGLNGTPLENKRLKVSYARPSSSDIQHANLYISKLDPTVTKERLDAIFAPYGTIIDSKILIDPMTGASRCVGFVRFDTRAQAEMAIAGLNGVQPEGMAQPIGVKFADTVEDKLMKKRKMTGMPYGSPGYGKAAPYSPYGAYAGYGGARYSPYGAAGHYGGYGMGADAYGYDAGAHAAVDPYGYAAYYGAAAPAAAYGAPPAATGTSAGGAATTAAPGGTAAAASSQQYCLFVYNLPPTSDDNYLYRLFSPYGALYNVRLVRDLATGACKGYGFVNFMKLEDAQQAIMALNGYPIMPNKALQVSFKTQKGASGGAGAAAPPAAAPAAAAPPSY